jgi:hypothetical protein
MKGPRVLGNPVWMVLGSALCAASMWLYVQRVLVTHQISDAAAHGKPRGTFSDLYPRWLGARELLLHGRDPYSAAVTREIQIGYYGRPLDSARPYDPKDQQGFAYPVYVAFYLAPTIKLPFDVVRRAFFWVLLGLTAVSVPRCLRFLQWRVPLWTQASIAVLTVGSLAVVQGLKLQQMTLAVVALMAVAIVLLVTDRQIVAGILLALATIKPQLVFLLLFWLAIWTAADWKRRYRWAASFLMTMTVLFVAAEIWLPHWIPRFWQAAREYQRYTEAVPILHKLTPAPLSGFLEVAAGMAAIHVCWKNRKYVEHSPAFAFNTCLVLAVTLVIVPTFALYNQVLLLPALLTLARGRRAFWDGSLAGRVLLVAVAVLLSWQWLSSIVLAGLSFVMPLEVVQKAWAVPGWTALTFPVAVAAQMLFIAYREPRVARAERVTA